MIATARTKIPPAIKSKLNPKNPITKPEIKEPMAMPNGEKTVSKALASSGYSFIFLDNNPLLPEPDINPPIDWPNFIRKIVQKFENIPKAPKIIEDIPVIAVPSKIFFALFNFSIRFIAKKETGTNAKESKEIKNRIKF